MIDKNMLHVPWPGLNTVVLSISKLGTELPIMNCKLTLPPQLKELNLRDSIREDLK